MKNKDINYRQGRSKKRVKSNEEMAVLSFIGCVCIVLLILVVEGIKQFI